MSKHLFRALSTSLLALVLFACESKDSSEGSLTVEKDLTLSSLAVTGSTLSPVFDPQNLGPYVLNLAQTVDSLDFVVGSPADTQGVNLLAFRRVVATTGEPTGRTDEQVVSVGETFSFSLEPGDNLFAVRVQTDNEEQFIDYLVSAHRVSNVAELFAVTFDDLTTVTSEALVLTNPDEFDSAVFEYALTAPFSRCSVGISAFGADRYTTVEMEGEVLERGEIRYIELAVGENVIALDVTSEDETNQETYSFTITRSEADSDDISDNNSLSALGFSSGDLVSTVGSDGFNCLLSTYNLRIDNEESTVSVSATPSIDGRVVELVDIVTTEDDDGNTVTSLENPREIPADGVLELDISDEAEDNLFAISLARNDDDEPQAHYSFSAVRSERNLVYVSTGEELQQALQNAVPNQEIVITAEGQLSAGSTLETSGKEGVFYFSNASGTEEQPIVLRSENSVSLSGSSLSEGAVLELAGDYWEVRDLNLTTAAYGLVLDSASHNVIENIDISDVGLRGIHLKNDSDDNVILSSEVTNIGAEAGEGEGFGEAVAIGSSPSEWDVAPNLEDDSSLNQNNRLVNLSLGPNVSGELLHIHAGTNNTSVFSVDFDSRDLNGAADAPAAVIVSGNNTSLSYSSFLNASSSNLSSAVVVLDIDDEGVSDAWGEEGLIFDNYLESTNVSLPTVVADASVELVSVDDNVRSDAEASVYSGAAIDESFDSPLYTIQWLNPDDNLAYCLQDELTTEVSTGSEVSLITAVLCDDSVQQQWDFVSDTESFVLIRPAQSLETKLVPNSGGTFSSGSLDILVLSEDEGTEVDTASSSRWKAVFVDGENVHLTNKFGSAYGVTLIDRSDDEVYETSNNIAYISLLTSSDFQLFRLVPVN